MINKKFCALFGRPVRNSEQEKIEQFHMDIAASIQYVLELILLKITKKHCAVSSRRATNKKPYKKTRISSSRGSKNKKRRCRKTMISSSREAENPKKL